MTGSRSVPGPLDRGEATASAQPHVRSFDRQNCELALLGTQRGETQALFSKSWKPVFTPVTPLWAEGLQAPGSQRSSWVGEIVPSPQRFWNNTVWNQAKHM